MKFCHSCVLKFTATDGRFYSDFYPRSFNL